MFLPIIETRYVYEGKDNMLRYIIGAAVGAVLGYLYYRLVGCSSGTCPITSNPYISTIYGAVIGVLISIAFKK